MVRKIFFVASYPDSLINFRLHLMQAFLSKGYEVVALAPYDAQVKEALAKFSIRFIDIPMQRNGLNPWNDLRLLLTLKKIFQREKPGLVFAYTIKPVIYTSFAAVLAHVPKIYLLITGTGYVFSKDTLKNRIVGFIAKRLFSIALSYASKVFFQNPDNRQFFINEKLIAKDQATAVVNGSGVDCHYFSPKSYPQNISFLMIARLLHDKGVCEYVEAARLLRKRYPQITCYLAGWIDTNPNAVKQEQLTQWIAHNDIVYLGKLDDVRPALANASVYVLPSYHEGTPRTVLEAMAMGRPIITTDTAGCRETVVENHNGFLVPVKNVDALVQAMDYFLEHPDAIAGMGNHSRQLAVEKYDVNKVNSSILLGLGIE